MDNLEHEILLLASEIDHPEHYNDEEHEEVCTMCNSGLVYGKQRWPCIYRKHAERIRSVVEQARSQT